LQTEAMFEVQRREGKKTNKAGPFGQEKKKKKGKKFDNESSW